MADTHYNSLPPGYRLGKFEIEGVLGEGGFGITYKAWDTTLQQPRAIKEYLPGEFAVRLDDSRVRAKSAAHSENYTWGIRRFLKEAQTLARFDHPNIVRVLDFFEQNDTAYMVMEYYAGESLQQRIREGRGPKTEAEILALVRPLLRGLSVVHAADILHLDIKPANIYIWHHRQVPVLLDFGAARELIAQHSRSAASVFTPGYAAVEQYHESGKRGPWTDIYGMGATLYQLVSGAPPEEAPGRVEHDDLKRAVDVGRGRYSANFLGAIDTALAVFGKDRPRNCSDWEAMLTGNPPSDSFPRQSVEPQPLPRSSDPTRISGGNRSPQPPAEWPLAGERTDTRAGGAGLRAWLGPAAAAVGIALTLSIALSWGYSQYAGLQAAKSAAEAQAVEAKRQAEAQLAEARRAVEAAEARAAEARRAAEAAEAQKAADAANARRAEEDAADARRAADAAADARTAEARRAADAARTDVLAAPPPSQPLVGGLQVAVNAPGAEVTVDGKPAGGATPTKALNVRDLPVGEVTVRVEAPGYDSVEQTFRIRQGEWTKAKLVMTKSTVEAPPPVAAPEPEPQPEPAPVAAWSGRFTDNGDGTVTDTTTRLVWEKLSDDGTIHDKDDTYTWVDAIKTKIARLNSTRFAGYRKWRLPTKEELETLLDRSRTSPATWPPFQDSCRPGCDSLKCNCTQASGYWSSSGGRGPAPGWGVDFNFAGGAFLGVKTSPTHVRAVHQGSSR